MRKSILFLVLLAGVFGLAASINRSTLFGDGPEPVPVCPDGVCATQTK